MRSTAWNDEENKVLPEMALDFMPEEKLRDLQLQQTGYWVLSGEMVAQALLQLYLRHTDLGWHSLRAGTDPQGAGSGGGQQKTTAKHDRDRVCLRSAHRQWN